MPTASTAQIMGNNESRVTMMYMMRMMRNKAVRGPFAMDSGFRNGLQESAAIPIINIIKNKGSARAARGVILRTAGDSKIL